jgi:hypothetical protein
MLFNTVTLEWVGRWVDDVRGMRRESERARRSVELSRMGSESG